MYVSELINRSSTLFGGGAIPDPPIKRRSVHITDMRAFCQCRLKWDLESLLRRGLQPAILPAPLFLGQGVHIGLDHGYRESLARGDGETAFDAHAAVRAFSSWAERRLDDMVYHAGDLWVDEEDTYDELVLMGKIMLTHYGLWASKQDRYVRLLGLEKLFSVPVPSSRCVQYEGRFDGLIESKKTGELYILEFKTSAHMTDNSLSSVFRGMQATAYRWAAREVYGREVAGVVYRVLWKRIPDTPRMTQKGGFSRAKTQKLTEEWLDHCLNKMADREGERAPLEQAAAGLREMIRIEQPRFFLQRIIKRSDEQTRQMLRVLRDVGGQMVDPRTPVFPMPGFHCSFCRFKDVCDLMQEERYDLAEDILSAEFAPRTYWEDYEVED